jgi:ABC-2 type transport system ATP-binding protein
VLDEPTNGLDPQGTREVRHLITDLGRDGVTVLVSSHLLSEVEQMCTHVGVMSVGRLVWQGSMADLAAAQRVQVVVSTPDRSTAASVLASLGLADAGVTDDGARAVLGQVDAADVTSALVHAGVAVRGLAVERPRLEEVFVGLTGEGFDVSG